MERCTTVARKRAAVVILFLLGCLSFLGCAGMRQVPVENRILFSEKESAEGVFSSGSLHVSFNYSLKGRALALTGNAGYSGGYDSLNVYVLFIDASGAVLQRNLVYYSGYRLGFWPGGSAFQANLDVPASAAGFSFDYSAQARTIRR